MPRGIISAPRGLSLSRPSGSGMTTSMAEPARDPKQPRVVAGIDLGSNSFHLLIARSDGLGRVDVLDKLKVPVRLAAGLSDDGSLSTEAQFRALDALSLFSQRLQNIPARAVRAVGTNTLRRAKNGGDFLARAKDTLGCEIDIISGPEEARLIYEGVCMSSYFDGRRLVMDIGGGSTELVIGDGHEPIQRDSLFMGCVSYTGSYFADGKITEKSFEAARLGAQRELQSIAQTYRDLGWERATGASGTLKAVGQVLGENGWSDGTITASGLDKLVEELIEQKKISKLSLDGLDADRAPVFAGGVAIVSAAFELLGIEQMDISDGALREGVVHELLGREERGDIRDHTTDLMAERYGVDVPHAELVEQTMLSLFQQVEDRWRMPHSRSKRNIHWIARLHEIGLSLAYSGHHRHASYLIKRSEMPGFSREQQEMIGSILKNQRRKMKTKRYRKLSKERRRLAKQLTVLLRLAALVNRSRRSEEPPALDVLHADEERIDIIFPEGWLDTRPLTQADLEEEADYLKKAGITLSFR